MADRGVQRRLAAILAADVEGFSRLMGDDEEATVATLRRHREITDRLIDEHDGRIANTAGDSIIAVFDSIVEAVRAATAIQAELAPLNAILPKQRQVQFRIGVNLGDVILEGEDVLGDGVNIAARLEGLADAGGISISQNVFDQVSDKLPYTYEDLGEQRVKNIARPVRAYRITTGNTQKTVTHRTGLRPPRLAIIAVAGIFLVLVAAGWYWQGGDTKPTGLAQLSTAQRAAVSVIVLPFTNATGDAAQDYIADGLTASVTSDLSRIRDAFVVATRTAFTYKNKLVDLQQLGKDLGVRFVLQGNVQRSGDTLRINAQLADTETSAQLWSETFEGNTGNLFALQDQVTARIGNSIGRKMVVLTARESKTRIGNPQATDLILRATAAFMGPQSVKNLGQIEDLFRQALTLDPQNAEAMAGLARALVVTAFNFGNKLTPDVKEQKFVEARDVALRAKEIDPNNPRIYGILALYYATHNDFPGQRRASETWLSLDPKNPMAYNFVANTHIYQGKYQEAIDLLDQGTALDPKHPNVLLAVTYFRTFFLMGNDDLTIDWTQRAQELNPRFSEALVFMAMAHARKGEDVKARKAVAKLAKANPKFKLTNFRKPQSSRPAAHNDAYDGIILPAGRKAGLPE